MLVVGKPTSGSTCDWIYYWLHYDVGITVAYASAVFYFEQHCKESGDTSCAMHIMNESSD